LLFENIKFDENARMLSVVLHDNLDGEYLFVGHVGVMVPDKDGFLFVEKLTFEEPYQAIKFASKEECYKYLQGKYADYTAIRTSSPRHSYSRRYSHTMKPPYTPSTIRAVGC